MAIAALQGIEHEFDKLELLRGVNLELSKGERVALVGANGSGKTTIFHILSKELRPTHGQVFWAKSLRVEHLRQNERLDGEQTVREVARLPFKPVMELERQMRELSAAMSIARGEELGRMMKQYGRLEAEHTAAGGFSWEHRVEEVLAGLGFEPEQRELPCRVLSGGQQGRLALARALLGGAGLLLLDEPTNHLDLDAVQWLEKYLLRIEAAVLLISHDRYLLDRVATKVYELRYGRVEPYPGNYSNYVQQREIRRLQQQRQFEKDQEYIAKERDFIARFHASGSRSREARGRATRLERRLKAGEFLLDSPASEHSMKLRIAADSRGSDLAMRLGNVSKTYGAARILREVTLDILNGNKMAVLGPNGVGKTTLLRIALGDERPDDGGVAKLGRGMTVGYYDQRQTGLDENLTVLEQLQSFTGSHDEGYLRGVLARFLYSGNDVYKAVRTLSGGERSRLLLSRLFCVRPNFLVLDEPTNHLDIPAREALESALREYDGTVLLVSHDRYFVDRVCNRLLLLKPDGWELIEGNYSHWRMLEEEKAAREQQALQEAELQEAEKPTRKHCSVNRSQAGAKGVTKVAGLNSYQLGRLTLMEVEEQIHQAERELLETEKSFMDPAVFSQSEKLTEAQERYDQLRAEIDRLMEIWQVKMEQGE